MQKGYFMKLSSSIIFCSLLMALLLAIFFYPAFYTQLEETEDNVFNIDDYQYMDMFKAIGLMTLLYENILGVFTYIKFEGNPKIS